MEGEIKMKRWIVIFFLSVLSLQGGEAVLEDASFPIEDEAVVSRRDDPPNLYDKLRIERRRDAFFRRRKYSRKHFYPGYRVRHPSRRYRIRSRF